MSAAPVPCTWTGKAFEPLPRFHNYVSAHYVEGEVYPLLPHEERSWKSHGHYFATMNDLWASLPEEEDRFPTVDHLRRYALIRTGYRDERSIVCASKAEAQRMAAFVKPMDEYAVVLVTEAVVTVLTAKSQSMKAMGAKEFGASKQAVLEFVAHMIGIDPDSLQRSARAA
jgi:hypothetical protein